MSQGDFSKRIEQLNIREENKFNTGDSFFPNILQEDLLNFDLEKTSKLTEEEKFIPLCTFDSNQQPGNENPYGDSNIYQTISINLIRVLSEKIEEVLISANNLSVSDCFKQLTKELGIIRHQLATKMGSKNSDKFGKMLINRFSETLLEFEELSELLNISVLAKRRGDGVIQHSNFFCEKRRVKVCTAVLLTDLELKDSVDSVIYHLSHDEADFETYFEEQNAELINLINTFRDNDKDPKAYFKRLACIFWNHTNFMPYYRGSAAIATWWTYAFTQIMNSKGVLESQITLDHVDDLLPFLVSREEFCEYFVAKHCK